MTEVKVVLPLPKDRTFIFPRLCVICLKPAEKYITADYTRLYGRHLLTYSIKVPYCNERYKKARLKDLAHLLIVLLMCLSPILFIYIISWLPLAVTYESLILWLTFLSYVCRSYYISICMV